MKRRVMFGGAILAAATAFAAVPAADASSVGAKVTAVNYEFAPGSVTIRKGQKVVWKFVEGKHDVKGKGFDSGIKKSGKYKHAFNKTGTFNYKCTIHSDMKGSVTVTG